jgi:hypothetical protein
MAKQLFFPVARASKDCSELNKVILVVVEGRGGGGGQATFSGSQPLQVYKARECNSSRKCVQLL